MTVYIKKGLEFRDLFLYLLIMNKSYKQGFTRSERNGILLLCVVIVISIVAKKYVVNYFAIDDTKMSKLDEEKFEQLQRQINDAKISYANKYSAKEEYKATNNFNSKEQSTVINNKFDFKIEVNSATAEEYEKLYGIGKVFAQRIVSFRDKLGGFYSINQVKHVYGIEDSVFQKFKKNLSIKPAKIKKLNINTATFEELTANPYFFSTIAKQIIGYRTKVKPFETIEDIKNLYFVKDHPEHYDKMLPYVAID